jgi:serine/threonine-protein kinase
MAMKLLREDLSRNRELVERFQNEAIAASRIGQENIVAVTDFGRTSADQVYLVMEELHGRALSDAIALARVFPAGRALSIAAQVTRALHAAHAAGIVHRDLKPENVILIDREGVSEFVKVLDFGISKMTEGTGQKGQRLTKMGMVMGTPEYMSPEQATGRQVDHRSDIYSLGVVLYEMLAGRLPFEAENSLAMLMKHQGTPPPKFADVRPGLVVPPMLEAVVLRALEKKPEQRQQSMAQCLAEFQACAQALNLAEPMIRPPVPTTPPNMPGVLALEPSTELPPPRITQPGRSRKGTTAGWGEAEDALPKPSRRGWAIAALALVLIGGVAGAYLWTRPAAAPPPPAVAPVAEPAPPPPAALPALPTPVLPAPPPEVVAPAPARPAPPRPEPSHRQTATKQSRQRSVGGSVPESRRAEVRLLAVPGPS